MSCLQMRHRFGAPFYLEIGEYHKNTTMQPPPLLLMLLLLCIVGMPLHTAGKVGGGGTFLPCQ